MLRRGLSLNNKFRLGTRGSTAKWAKASASALAPERSEAAKMTITVEAVTGTQTVSTTEWGLNANSAGPGASTTAGIYQAFLDLSALAAGDVFEFRAYEKCRTGDTQRQIYSARFAHAQGSPLWVSPTLVLGVGWDMTLKKISGTNRAINWRISKVA